ncbi:DNA-directed RNA polymerases iii kda polypeptide [Colletotrichum chrysophilum]|uniref:DNA-directed RNA polymerases iii kDa polypeptide n=1 Tax=Colletotrichum chrysophilum TaxID=1836956 RepID=A0AAD9ANH5_9PEZI|nr:DNA-directed RNA polymerases iii kda polypeptide [Colletotrichum chrysophilum]
MLLFCPNCANILTVSAYAGVRNRLECRTCPFEHAITEPIYSRREFERKEREDVFGGPGEWDNADKARAQCPKDGCNGEEAAFFQVQIRSADEPMTTFFKVRRLHDLRNEMERELKRMLSLVYTTSHCVALGNIHLLY